MTVEHPVYRFNMTGQPPMQLEGREQVEPLYRHWAETNQSIFYNESETVAVGDWMVVSTMTGYQQTLGLGPRRSRSRSRRGRDVPAPGSRRDDLALRRARAPGRRERMGVRRIRRTT